MVFAAMQKISKADRRYSREKKRCIDQVDWMIHWVAAADDPNLGFVFRRNGQQFVEFCGHDLSTGQKL
jgi:hypothetical protein